MKKYFFASIVLAAWMGASLSFAQNLTIGERQSPPITTLNMTGAGNNSLPPYLHSLQRLETLLIQNSDIKSIKSLESLRFLRDVTIRTNSQLTEINTIRLDRAGAITIVDNTLLKEVRRIFTLSGGVVQIRNNPALSEITDLYITDGQSLTIVDNANLIIFSDSKFLHLTGEVEIERNPSLSALHTIGFDGSGADISISNNPKLKGLKGVVFVSIGGAIRIKNNSILEFFQDIKFENTRSMIEISNNPELKSFDAVEFVGIRGVLSISNNPKLITIFKDGLGDEWKYVSEAYLFGNNLSHDVLSRFGDRPINLTKLDISNNIRMFKLPMSFAWSRISELNISGAGFQEIPAVIPYMHFLQKLTLGGNCFSQGQYQQFHDALSPFIAEITPAPVDYTVGTHC